MTTTTLLSPKHVELIKASAPVLAEKGEQITTTFYKQMFEAHPELLNIFNHNNQKQGKQPKALMNTLYAAAVNIEKLEAILPTVKQIAHKHRALSVLPEHYPIVGKYLLKAMKDELGKAASEELIDAWAAAYGVVADIFINVEDELYKEASSQPGGWAGFRSFVLAEKKPESENVTSFYLKPEDGQPLPAFLPGQYVTIKCKYPGDEYTHMRHYSLSDAPGNTYYRLSIKREKNTDTPDGLISNFLHDELKEGNTIDLSAPAGTFTLTPDAQEPLVFLGAGIGLTPLMSMAKHALKANPNRPIQFVYTTPNEEYHALRDEMNTLADQNENFTLTVCYTEDGIRIDQARVKSIIQNDAQRYYLCGTPSFTQDMKKNLLEENVNEDQIHFEVFEPFIG